MGDDGAGLAVANILDKVDLPDGLRVEQLETDSLNLPNIWNGESQVWMVDAYFNEDAPGTINELSHDEIMTVPQKHESAHYLSLPESLRLLALANPEMGDVQFRLWGIEPESVKSEIKLSKPVAEAAEIVAGMINMEAQKVLHENLQEDVVVE